MQIANIYIDLKTDGQNNMMQSHDARANARNKMRHLAHDHFGSQDASFNHI